MKYRITYNNHFDNDYDAESAERHDEIDADHFEVTPQGVIFHKTVIKFSGDSYTPVYFRPYFTCISVIDEE